MPSSWPPTSPYPCPTSQRPGLRAHVHTAPGKGARGTAGFGDRCQVWVISPCPGMFRKTRFLQTFLAPLPGSHHHHIWPLDKPLNFSGPQLPHLGVQVIMPPCGWCPEHLRCLALGRSAMTRGGCWDVGGLPGAWPDSNPTAAKPLGPMVCG